MSHMRPIQIFTDLNGVSKPRRGFIVSSDNTIAKEKVNEENDMISSMDRQINVTGIGEVTLPPDRFSVTIKCKSEKDTVEDAKNSVTRRLDYIIQTLKNNSLKENQYRVYQHVSHQESGVLCESEVETQFSDLGKCLGVTNLLTEKLGPGVVISLPCCYHATGSLDTVRKQVGMLAIHNARQKALEMAKVIHLSVGHALQVQEQGMEEMQGAPNSEIVDMEMNPSILQRVAEKTVTISSKVTVCFQLKPSKPVNHK